MYYNIGLKLIENNKWGSSFIDTLAKNENDDFLQHDVAKLSCSSATIPTEHIYYIILRHLTLLPLNKINITIGTGVEQEKVHIDKIDVTLLLGL